MEVITIYLHLFRTPQSKIPFSCSVLRTVETPDALAWLERHGFYHGTLNPSPTAQLVSTVEERRLTKWDDPAFVTAIGRVLFGEPVVCEVEEMGVRFITSAFSSVELTFHNGVIYVSGKPAENLIYHVFDIFDYNYTLGG